MFETRAHGPVIVLRMAHGKASAFDLEFLIGLREQLARLAADDGVRAIVLTGTGSIFSAGMDLRRLLSGGRAYIEAVLPELEECVLELLAFQKPVIAAINGHAIAGGCVLACACDLRLLSTGVGAASASSASSSGGAGGAAGARGGAGAAGATDAAAASGSRTTRSAAPRLGVPELIVGVPFPAAVLETVRCAVSPQTFAALVLRGLVCGPDEALARGLVDELLPHDELLPRALAVAAELAAMPAVAYAETKRLARAPALERARTTSAARRAWLVDAWASDEVQSALRRHVDTTLGPR